MQLKPSWAIGILAGSLFSYQYIFGASFLDNLIPLLLLCLGILLAFSMQNGSFYFVKIHNRKRFGLFMLYFLLVVISIVRSDDTFTPLYAIATILKFLLVPLFAFLLYNKWSLQQKKERNCLPEFSHFLLISLCVFIGINLLAFTFLPIYPYDEAAAILRMLGITSNKTPFPLIGPNHPNQVGIVGGALFVMASAHILYLGKRTEGKKWAAAGVLLGMAAMVIGDSRGTLFFALVTISILYIEHNIKWKLLGRLTLISLPFLQIILIGLLKTFSGNAAIQQFARQKNDLTTGNSRQFVTNTSLELLGDFEVTHIIGFGYNGLYEAGLKKIFTKHFLETDEAKVKYLSVGHNAVIQAVFDTGYIGLAVFALLLFNGIKAIEYAERKAQAHIFLYKHFLLYYMLVGITESVFSVYYLELNMVFWVVIITVFMTENTLKTQNKSTYLPDFPGVPASQPLIKGKRMKHTNPMMKTE